MTEPEGVSSHRTALPLEEVPAIPDQVRTQGTLRVMCPLLSSILLDLQTICSHQEYRVEQEVEVV